MSAPGAGSSASVLAQLERKGTWKRLVRIAHWSTRDRFTAEDLVNETVAHVLGPEEVPWDGKGSFLGFMSFRFRAVFRGWMRRMSAHEVPVAVDELAEKAIDPGPLADEHLDARRLQERYVLLGKRLLVQLALQNTNGRWTVVRTPYDAETGKQEATTSIDLGAGEPLELVHRDVSPQNILVSCALSKCVGNGGSPQADFYITGWVKNGALVTSQHAYTLDDTGISEVSLALTVNQAAAVGLMVATTNK